MSVRVQLPAHLRTLARVGEGEVVVEVPAPVTAHGVVDALERKYPPLRGTVRDPVTRKRRAYVRFFACAQDISHEAMDRALPAAIAAGTEALLIVGAIAGG